MCCDCVDGDDFEYYWCVGLYWVDFLEFVCEVEFVGWIYGGEWVFCLWFEGMWFVGWGDGCWFEVFWWYVVVYWLYFGWFVCDLCDCVWGWFDVVGWSGVVLLEVDWLGVVVEYLYGWCVG